MQIVLPFWIRLIFLFNINPKFPTRNTVCCQQSIRRANSPSNSTLKFHTISRSCPFIHPPCFKIVLRVDNKSHQINLILGFFHLLIQRKDIIFYIHSLSYEMEITLHQICSFNSYEPSQSALPNTLVLLYYFIWKIVS